MNGEWGSLDALSAEGSGEVDERANGNALASRG